MSAEQRSINPQTARAIELRSLGLEHRETHRRLYIPDFYYWQHEFLFASATHNQSMLLASNRSGKTMTGSYATACDITGDYPEWWQGCLMNYPVNAWVLGVDSNQTRDVLQKELLGVRGGDGVWRGGWIHNEEIVGIDNSHMPGSVAKARVRHIAGGESVVSFRSYTQTSTGQSTLPMAGSSVDVMQIDEQPPDGIIGQLLTRTMTGRRGHGGIVRYTMTPELGMTDLVDQFMNRAGKHQALIGPIAWSECPHLSPEIQAELLASYPVHERDMRSKGVPMFGTGKVFTFDEEAIQCDPFDIQLKPWLRVIRALDIGIDHPTAIVWLAWDPEQDILYLVRTHRASDTLAAVHASVANSMWPNAPLVVPPDIDKREPGSGETVRSYYTAAGIKNAILFENPDESRYVEPGIFALQEAIATGRFKVFRGQAQHFIEECRSYHRDEKGKLVKARDDVIDAVRYGSQMIRQYGVTAELRKHAQIGGMYPQLGLNGASKTGGRRLWQQNNTTYRPR